MDVPHFIPRIGVVPQIAIWILANPVRLGLGEDRLSPGLFHLPYTLGFSVIRQFAALNPKPSAATSTATEPGVLL